MPEESRKILYLSHAQAGVYDLIRAEMPPGFELLTLETDSHGERIGKIAQAEVVIVASTPLTRELIAAARELKLVHHQGVGYQDTVDMEALGERKIPLALAPRGTTASVAEHTVLLMLAVLRRLTFADAELRRGRWHINSLRPESRNLGGSTIGYIGMGRIGRAVAERLLAFGTEGVYFDEIDPLDAKTAASLNLRGISLEELLGVSDIVTLHIPLTAKSRHLIDGGAIGRMKPGAVLINTARGGIVDETALYEGLKSGRLGGAGMDVYETEPPAPGNPLLKLPNVVLTPHIAAGTRDTFVTKMRAISENILKYYNGEELENRVLPDP